MQYSTVDVFSLQFSKQHLLFSTLFVRIQFTVHRICKICVNWLLPVKQQVNGSLLVLKFLNSQKLYRDFQLCEGSVPLTPTLFKALEQLSMHDIFISSSSPLFPSSMLFRENIYLKECLYIYFCLHLSEYIWKAKILH